MKLFVTGGTGFLGTWVLQDLLEHGHAVRAMVRHDKKRLPEGAEGVVARFDDDAGLTKALEGCDAVVHLAGKVSRDPKDASDMHWLHVEASVKLMNAMASVGIDRMVLASTSGTIAMHTTAGYLATERDAPDLELLGRFPYYLSKRLQEQETLRRAQQGLRAVILNPSLLLGPGDDRGSSTDDVLKILHGRVPAMTSGTVAFVDVRDVAPMFRAALEKELEPGERYLLNGANMSVRTFCDRIARAGGVSAPSLKLPDRWAVLGAKVMEGVYRAADLIPPVDAVSVDMSRLHWGCDAQRAKADLSFSPRDPQTTLMDTIRYLEKQGLFRR